MELPPELLNKSIWEWQLNGLTLYIAITALGRVWKALQNGGGVVGVWRALLFGTNTPSKEETK